MTRVPKLAGVLWGVGLAMAVIGLALIWSGHESEVSNLLARLSGLPLAAAIIVRWRASKVNDSGD